MAQVTPARKRQPQTRSRTPKQGAGEGEEKEKSFIAKIMEGGLLACALMILVFIGVIIMAVMALIAVLGPLGFGNRPSLTGSIDSPFDCNVEYPTNADEKKMTDYINSIIPSGSPLHNLGKNFVSSGKAGNKNPLFIAFFAQKESSWGTKGIATRDTFNPFGRTATSSQPHVTICNDEGECRNWYKFASWEAAVNEQGPYLKEVYQDQGLHTIQGIINKYAPPNENDTQTYIAEVRNFISSHTQKANGAFGIDPCVTVNLAGAGGPHSGSMSWPVPGHYALSSTFHSPSRPTHNGIDIPAPGGTTIIAAADGVVEEIFNCPYNMNNLPPEPPLECKKNKYNGVGVRINHQNGIKTVYLHFIPGSVAVQIGQSVKAGQVIGKMDNTGRSTGNHLHFGVQVNGEWVNPCGGFVKC